MKKIFLITTVLFFAVFAQAQSSISEKVIDASKVGLVVDYTKTVEQMIAAGDYNAPNTSITGKNFPIPKELLGKKVSLPYTAYTLFRFVNRNVSAEDVILAMDEDGYRPATLAELLALGASQPDLQKRFPIVALGSAWRSADGSHFVPVLRVGLYDYDRKLSLYWFGDDWDDYDRFLAVRK
jgi:hypothetical protein